MQKIKHLFLLAISFGAVFLLSGCQSTVRSDQNVKIVTSFYPLYEIAKNIGGEKVTVKNLVPAGSEPHDYEPSPQDIINLHDADLILYNGGGLEAWSGRLIPELQKQGIKTLKQSEVLKQDLIQENQDQLNPDPHFWLAPGLYEKEADATAQMLITIDPENQSFYQTNLNSYKQKIQSLIEKFTIGLKTCGKRFFVTSHAAFSYLAKDFKLEMIPIAGIDPESEPSAKTLVELTNIVKTKNIKYIFTETLLSPKIAETLAGETGAQTLVLNPLEGLSEKEISAGENYFSVMEKNLQNLRIALECN